VHQNVHDSHFGETVPLTALFRLSDLPLPFDGAAITLRRRVRCPISRQSTAADAFARSEDLLGRSNSDPTLDPEHTSTPVTTSADEVERETSTPSADDTRSGSWTRSMVIASAAKQRDTVGTLSETLPGNRIGLSRRLVWNWPQR